MNKICPNLKNKEVAKEFNELLEATSENAAYHIWSANNGHSIDKAPNGMSSKLFADLLSHYNGDRKLAIQAKARTFSKGFKTWFGESKVVDNNGEFSTKSKTRRAIEFANYKGREFDRTLLDTVVDDLTKSHRLATFVNDQTGYKETTDRGEKYFPIRNIYPVGASVNISESSALDIVNKIIKYGGTYSEYAKSILKYVKNNNTRVVLMSDMRSAGNTRYSFDNTKGHTEVTEAVININYNSNAFKSDPERLLLHEITHSLSSLAIAGNEDMQNTISGYIDHCKNYLSRNSKVSKIMGFDSVYGFSNPSEFVADFFTFKEFQDLLKQIPASDNSKFKNIFEQILSTILEWFTGPKTAYDQFLPVAKKILEVQDELIPDIPGLSELTLNQDIIKPNIVQQSSIDPAKLTNILHIDEVYKKLITAQTLRIKDIKNAANLDIKERQNVELQLQLIGNLEAGQALIQYIPLMQNDITSTIEKINSLNDKMLQAQSKGEVVEIPANVLLDIKRGFLGFYSSVITVMQDVFEDPLVVTYLTNKGVSMKDIELYKGDLQRIRTDYSNINRKYENLVTYQATNNLINYAKERGSTTIELLRKNILFADNDIGVIERYVYSPIHARDELLGQVADRLVGAKNKTEREVLRRGKELVKLQEGLSRSEIMSLFEMTKSGKKTTNLVRPLNHGEFKANQVAKQTALANEYGLPNIYERPQDRKQLLEYNRKMNEWYEANAERRYTKEYYDLFNSLSPEASMAREALQVELRMIYHDVTDKEGNVHLEDLSEEQWLHVLLLNKQKRDLSNPFNLDGSPKIGTEKDVAEELSKLNEALKTNLKYKVDLPAFKEAYLKAKRELSPDKFAKWVLRNTTKVVKQEFYDALAKLSDPKSDEYESLKTARNNLQRLYKTENGEIDADFMPDAVKAKIVEINTKMAELITLESTKDPEKTKLFNTVAEVIVKEGYAAAWENAANQGDEYLQRWVNLNTYKVVLSDGTSTIRPASFWTQIVPKDPKMYTHKPSSQWSVLEEASNFINPNFDQTSKDFAIPKKSKYDNSTNYNKIRSNPKLSKLYDGIYGMLSESNGILDFLYNIDNYKLPQIEANTFEIIGKTNTIKEGISTSLQNALAIRDIDTEYEGASPAVRSDGTYVKLIPTRYIAALEDPNTITDDIVGATIAYYSMALNHKNMRSIEPELNLIIDQMGKRTAEGGELGSEMKVYKRAIELMDMHMYGKRRQRGKNDEFTLFGKRLSKSKIAFGFASFLRLSTLSQNINVIMTGLLTNKINTRIEALTGEYFDSLTLLKAAKEVAFSYPSMIASLGKIKTTNKLSSAMEYNQVVFNNAEMFNNLHKSRVARTLQKHFWYGGHTMVDYSTKGRLTAAVYFNYKLFGDKFVNFSEFRTKNKGLDKKALKEKWNNLPTTLYDAYEVRDEQFRVKPQYSKIVSTILEDKVKNTIQMIGSRIDGQLSDIDRATIHTNCYAAFFVMFRNFMIQMLQTRLKKAHFNYSKGNWDEGYYTATVNYISRHVFNHERLEQLKELCDNFDELEEMEKTAVRRVSLELGINILMFTVIAQILASWADDDRRDWIKQEIAYLAVRTRLELSTPYNPLDLLNMFQNPTAAVPYLNTVVTLGELMWNPSEEVQSGAYKGHTKLFKGLMKLTPGKMYYEALDPASKRRYLENQIMKSDPVGAFTKFALSPTLEQD